MLRVLLINPLLMALLASLVFCASRFGALHIHLQASMLAAGTCLIATELSLVPLLLMRHSSQANVSQAGLLTTVVHMLLTAGLGMAVSAFMRPGASFMYWLLLFYWSSLICIAILAVRAVKSAPIRMPDAVTAVG